MLLYTVVECESPSKESYLVDITSCESDDKKLVLYAADAQDLNAVIHFCCVCVCVCVCVCMCVCKWELLVRKTIGYLNGITSCKSNNKKLALCVADGALT